MDVPSALPGYTSHVAFILASPVSCTASIKSLFRGAQLAKTNFQYEKRQKELEKKKKKEEKLKRKMEKCSSTEVEEEETAEFDESGGAPAPDQRPQP